MTPQLQGIKPEDIELSVQRALAEDVGTGDLSANLVPAAARAAAQVIAKQDAIVCGQAWFDQVFHQIDPRIGIAWQLRDGDAVHRGQLVCKLCGPARGILTGERTALNFLQFLSAIATRARQYADAVYGTKTAVLDTRKTIPGLREAQKYAVTSGGCRNHRMGLYDEILIKENHIQAAGSVTSAIQAAKHTTSDPMQIEIEVETLAQLQEALDAGATRVLLDNFTVDQLKAAVKVTAGRAKLEASGGISLEDIRRIAHTGVDFISIGDLTKNIQAVDFSMRFDNATAA